MGALEYPKEKRRWFHYVVSLCGGLVCGIVYFLLTKFKKEENDEKGQRKNG